MPSAASLLHGRGALPYFVYIVANENSNVLYIGVTNNLRRRVEEHRSGSVPGFSSLYRTFKLVYAEETHDVSVALAREKQLKRWRRAKKVALIQTLNPGWRDLLLVDGY